jgi:hypothetical protein
MITINPSSSVIIYVRLPQISGYSYPRVAAIQIDVHPAAENPTNMTCMLPTPVHVRPAYAFCGRSPYVATFHAIINRFEQVHCTQEEWLSTQSTARRLTDSWVHTELLSHNSQWSSGEKSSFCRQPTTRFTGPISPACNRYVQYLLAGASQTVLNRPRRGLQPWRCWFATYPLLDLPNQLSPLSPNGPARSPF